MLVPKSNSISTGEDEDVNVNEPFTAALKTTCMVSHTVHFTGKHANLIDSEGREQRVALSVHDGSRQEWATLVTVLEGKLKLSKPERDECLGQCMRRARAILEAQPWRTFATKTLTVFCIQRTPTSCRVLSRVKAELPVGKDSVCWQT